MSELSQFHPRQRGSAVLAGENPAVQLEAHIRLLGESLWEQLVERVIKDPVFQMVFGNEDAGTQRVWAERIVDQTVAFLRACAKNGGRPISPSALVDIGWHTFILHTAEYAEFCTRVSGRFIHHAPHREGVPNTNDGIRRAIAALRLEGLAVDEALWGWATASNRACGCPVAGATLRMEAAAATRCKEENNPPVPIVAVTV